ncbi:MAG TPA: hypothetical protein VJ577_01590 [Burkholderiaceae bacterium]|nr:hypothetical protein [Burkholderiaceae bacterium]
MHLHPNKILSVHPSHRLLSRSAVLLGIFWALPLTLIGLLIAVPILLLRGRAYLVHDTTPALLVRGPFADVLLARHPFGAMCAMAIGHVVIADRHGLSRQILTHELAHVHQAARWGIVFPFAYCAASAWAVLRGRDAYWHNIFEIAARNAEQHM